MEIWCLETICTLTNCTMTTYRSRDDNARVGLQYYTIGTDSLFLCLNNIEITIALTSSQLSDPVILTNLSPPYPRQS